MHRLILCMESTGVLRGWEDLIVGDVYLGALRLVCCADCGRAPYVH